MLMLKASYTSAIQRGQAQWSSYKSTSTHLMRCPFLGKPAPANQRKWLDGCSSLFRVIFHIIGQGLCVSWRAIEVFLFVWVRHKAVWRQWHLRCFILLCWPKNVKCLRICLRTRGTVDMHNQGEVCGFRQPYETFSACSCFCIYLHNLTVFLVMQLEV